MQSHSLRSHDMKGKVSESLGNSAKSITSEDDCCLQMLINGGCSSVSIVLIRNHVTADPEVNRLCLRNH